MYISTIFNVRKKSCCQNPLYGQVDNCQNHVGGYGGRVKWLGYTLIVAL